MSDDPLELEACAQLAGTISPDTCHVPKVRAAHVHVRVIPIVVVEEIEEVGSETGCVSTTLAKVELLGDRCVLARCCPLSPALKILWAVAKLTKRRI